MSQDTLSIKDEITAQAQLAVKASRQLTAISTTIKQRALLAMSEALLANQDAILAANKVDMENATTSGLSTSMLDRLMLDEARVADMAKALSDISSFREPVGRELSSFHRPNGLVIEKVTCPIGVIGIIYESRPNVTADAAALCLMAGNATILKGGKEAIKSNLAIAQAMSAAGVKAGLPEGFMQLIANTERESVALMLKMDDYINLIIPRGGEGLIRYVAHNSSIPVIKHSKGVCTIYVDKDANLDNALAIAINAKCQRPGVCNAAECILIHEDVAAEFVPKLSAAFQEHLTTVQGNEAYCQLDPFAKPATEEDFGKEYLELSIHARVVADSNEAIDYINTYGSGHSDAIISDNRETTKQFTLRVDSAAVYVNASTRFTDGSQFGMGAEIGISTDRLHARGPMGIDELTTYKYVITGEGQIRN